MPPSSPPDQGGRGPGERWRAPYASDPARAGPRLHPEPGSPTRSAFQRDRDRVLHSAAFRRLMHKTQVFIFHEGDHYRTRLTHTLEVAQIARALSRSLGLDEDLAEALALAHDLGHTPFGHTGEDALRACLASHGGFDHNAQALRVVTRLERRYAAFDGLNLVPETLEGLAKHNGPLVGPDARPLRRYAEAGMPEIFRELDAQHGLRLDLQGPAEAQAAAIADDIAYAAHDIDDGLRSGLLSFDELRTVPFLGALAAEIDALHPGLDPSRRIHELTRRVITGLVEDVLKESGRRLDGLRPGSADDVRRAPAPVVAFSEPAAEADRAMKAFLFPKLYRHPKLLVVREDAEAVVRDLFSRLAGEPDLMPPEWRPSAGAGAAEVARAAADYIAGMTDRFALEEHRRLFPSSPSLRLP